MKIVSRPKRCPTIKNFSNSLTNVLLVSSSILQLSLLLYFIAETQKQHVIGPMIISLPTATHHHKITVDILSIGSQSRLDYIHSQKMTFASHRSVRNFYSVTEHDDADPMCANKLTTSDVIEISRFCRNKAKWNPRRQFLMTYLKSSYVSKFHLL